MGIAVDDDQRMHSNLFYSFGTGKSDILEIDVDIDAFRFVVDAVERGSFAIDIQRIRPHRTKPVLLAVPVGSRRPLAVIGILQTDEIVSDRRSVRKDLAEIQRIMHPFSDGIGNDVQSLGRQKIALVDRKDVQGKPTRLIFRVRALEMAGNDIVRAVVDYARRKKRRKRQGAGKKPKFPFHLVLIISETRFRIRRNSSCIEKGKGLYLSLPQKAKTSRGGAVVARQAHNLKVVSSNLAPARIKNIE